MGYSVVYHLQDCDQMMDSISKVEWSYHPYSCIYLRTMLRAVGNHSDFFRCSLH